MTRLTSIECEGGRYYVAENVVVDDDAIVGPETRIWEGARVREGSRIGAGCVIAADVHIEGATLGDFSKVQRGVTLYRGVIAGDYVFFGPNSTTTNDRNPRAFGDWELAETVIETGASIGANATLVAGRRIGALALVGAGSVVTRDVAPASLVIGNPARFAGWVDLRGNVINSENLPADMAEAIKNPRVAIEDDMGRRSEVEA